MTIENTLLCLLDLEAIRDLARRYAHCVWTKDVEAAIALFAEDGEMNMGDRPSIKGHPALREAYQEMINGKLLQPFVHNHVIDLDGNRATGTCYLDLRVTVDDKAMIGAGYYNDTYIKSDGIWKFQARNLTLVYLVPITEGWVQQSARQAS